LVVVIYARQRRNEFEIQQTRERRRIGGPTHEFLQLANQVLRLKEGNMKTKRRDFGQYKVPYSRVDAVEITRLQKSKRTLSNAKGYLQPGTPHRR
jgi:hypothetical protein